MALEIKRVFQIEAFDLTWYQLVAHWNYCQELKKDNNCAEEAYRQEKREAIKNASIALKIKDGIHNDIEKGKVSVSPEQKEFMNMLGWGRKKVKTQDKVQ